MHMTGLKSNRGSAGTSKCTLVTRKSTAGTLSTVCLALCYLYAHRLACCPSSFPANRFARRSKRFAFCSTTICPNGLHTVCLPTHFPIRLCEPSGVVLFATCLTSACDRRANNSSV